jgi:hypothetical protein
MSKQLFEFVDAFLDDQLSAKDFAEQYQQAWKAEGANKLLLLDSPQDSEKLSSIFCLADLHNPDPNRADYEFDDQMLKYEIKKLIRDK